MLCALFGGIAVVSFVIVSHSRILAEGVVELASQMAEDVVVLAAGGMADGGVGTDVARVQAAIEQAMSPDGVVILADLGSSLMSAEIAIESCENKTGPIVIGDGPLVEGAVVGVTTAGAGAELDEVLEVIKQSRMLPQEP
jgi:dihydroxyacetone kinase phosphotransfer subunit